MISFLGRLMDLLSPRQCAECQCRLRIGEEILCAECNLHLPRTHFDQSPDDNEMARLFWGRVPVERCGALFYYQPGSASSRIIKGLKYYDHPERGIAMGRMMAAEFMSSGFFDGIDVLVPVPLAPGRERQRGYNQSVMIARGVSQITHLPVRTNVMRRDRFVESQTSMDRSHRADNVEDAFSLVSGDEVSSKHVLLIDDVVTTGATLCACATVLTQIEGIRLSMLSLAFSKT